MGMTQIVVGAALGCIAAQGGLYGVRRLLAWLQRDEVGARIRAMTPPSGHALIGAFIRYAAPVGASVAVITLGVWAVGDYIAARAERSATMANVTVAESPPAVEVAQAPPRAEPPHPGPAPKVVEPPVVAAASKVDPFSDPDYKVQRPAHRPGTALTLKETLVRRSEAKARNELLREIQRNVARSQYDCEAADRAGKYLKADLDVWGFASWQAKHFPMEGYKGATLPQCRTIKNVVDPGALDLQSTVAQRP
jgi:hypothetical protein